VQLDPVRCDTGLAVEDVPESDARDDHVPVQDREVRGSDRGASREERAASCPHLRSLERRGDASGVRELHDHRLRAVRPRSDDEVDVGVVLDLRLYDLGADAYRLTLDPAEAGRVLVDDRTVQSTQDRQSSIDGAEVHRMRCRVRQRLHVPPLDAARDSRDRRGRRCGQ